MSNQFNAIGGVAAGVENQALSVDHLEVLNEEDIIALKGSKNNACSLAFLFLFLKHSIYSR